jgi:Polysaccharide biosynthesis C-terminal domain
VASTAPLTLQSLDRIGVTVKIGVAEALACVILTAALPGLLGWGLIGMALGTTLPRLFSCLVVYPRLALVSMGPDLWHDMRRGLLRNLAMCAGVAVVFVGVHHVMPAHTWLGLVAGVALVVVLHVLALGHRYEAFPVVERLQSRALSSVRRFWAGSA